MLAGLSKSISRARPPRVSPVFGVPVLDRHAVGQQLVEPAVVLDQRRVRRARQGAHDLLDFVVRQIGIEAMQRRGEPALEQNLRRIGALAGVVDLDAVSLHSNPSPRNWSSAFSSTSSSVGEGAFTGEFLAGAVTDGVRIVTPQVARRVGKASLREDSRSTIVRQHNNQRRGGMSPAEHVRAMGVVRRGPLRREWCYRTMVNLVISCGTPLLTRRATWEAVASARESARGFENLLASRSEESFPSPRYSGAGQG